MKLNTIITGDVLEVIKTLDDKSVNCCVTSPPYYGLRDYGTAKWEGGNTECDHRTFDNDIVNAGKKQKTNIGSNRTFKDVCKRCGAIRIDNQIGLEGTPEAYVQKLVEIFREVKRVLKDDGTLWLNLGDSYSSHKDCKSVGQTLAKGTNRETAHEMELGKSRVRDTKMLKSQGLKNKDLIGIPWMVAFALRADGWYLRQDIIWHKPNPMPESVTDRCTKAHEYIFLLSKSQKYYFDNKAIGQPIKSESIERNNRGVSVNHKNIQIPGQSPHSMHKARKNGETYEFNEIVNKRSVWTVTTKPFSDAHFATFPPDLIVDCIKAGCPENGIVLDPFMGAGTTAVVSRKLNRNFVGIELNPKYTQIANKRLITELGLFL